MKNQVSSFEIFMNIDCFLIFFNLIIRFYLVLLHTIQTFLLNSINNLLLLLICDQAHKRLFLMRYEFKLMGKMNLNVFIV